MQKYSILFDLSTNQSIKLHAKAVFFEKHSASNNLYFSGDPVSFLVEKAPSSLPTKYVAKQVLVSENTATILEKALEYPEGITKKQEEKVISSE